MGLFETRTLREMSQFEVVHIENLTLEKNESLGKKLNTRKMTHFEIDHYEKRSLRDRTRIRNMNKLQNHFLKNTKTARIRKNP